MALFEVVVVNYFLHQNSTSKAKILIFAREISISLCSQLSISTWSIANGLHLCVDENMAGRQFQIRYFPLVDKAMAIWPNRTKLKQFLFVLLFAFELLRWIRTDFVRKTFSSLHAQNSFQRFCCLVTIGSRSRYQWVHMFIKRLLQKH